MYGYVLIHGSGLYDKDWYLARNPDVAQAKVEPLFHYLLVGGFEGRDPGPNFSSQRYMEVYEDVRKAGLNPLVHYLRYGRHEARIVSPSLAQTVARQANLMSIRRDPIIVHQMGKVGSRTVLLSLTKTFEELGIEVPVYHTHALAGFEMGRQKAAEEQGQRNPESRLAALAHGERIRKLIDDNPVQHWNLITLVRDPVARNVATFFQNLSEYAPDWHERYAAGMLSTQEVQALFLQAAPAYDVLDLWFDSQMKAIPAFGIDVYASPFSRELGYKIYPGDAQASLLLIRLENLKECAKSAMQEFLGLENFTLQNTNLADEKDYAVLYQAFKELPLPLEYVESIYKTQFARHFYSEAELTAFTNRWTQAREIERNVSLRGPQRGKP